MTANVPMSGVASAAMLTWGQLLQRERERLGLTRSYVASKCGVSNGTPLLWETDKAAPTAAALQRLYGFLRPMRHHGFHLAALRRRLGVPLDAAPPNPEGEPETFGRALARFRLENGLSQIEVAALVGGSVTLDQGVISRWEHSRAVPNDEHHANLVSLFPGLAAFDRPRGREQQFGRNQPHSRREKEAEAWTKAEAPSVAEVAAEAVAEVAAEAVAEVAAEAVAEVAAEAVAEAPPAPYAGPERRNPLRRWLDAKARVRRSEERAELVTLLRLALEQGLDLGELIDELE